MLAECCLSLEVKAIVTAGMAHYRALRWGLDILVANDQLELLLSRRSASRSSTGVWAARLGCHPHCCPGQGLRQCKHVEYFMCGANTLQRDPSATLHYAVQTFRQGKIREFITLLCLTA